MSGVATDFDVVVVGGGGAGLAAASAAAALGRKVLLLEKNPQLGGSTSYSVGSVTATSTSYQLRAGILDSPEDHWEDLQQFAGEEAARDNPQLGRLLAEHTPEMFRWLESTGLQFVGPMPEPPHRRPRMHNVLPNSQAFPYHLGRHCRRQGVQIVTGERAEALEVEDGRAVAVRTIAANGNQRLWRARGGIVLASGDYSGSSEMKRRYGSAEAALADPVNPGSTGDGIRLGLQCGGVILNGDHMRGPFLRFVPPRRPSLIASLPPVGLITRTMRWAYAHLPPALLRPLMMKFLTTTLAPDKGLLEAGAALVDRHGQLVANTWQEAHGATARAPGGVAYIVFDDRVARLFAKWPHFVSTAPGVAYAYLDDYRRTRSDIYFQGDTLVALASKLGMPAEALQAAVRENGNVGAGPYYALGPAKAYVVFTNGGLKVSERLEVLRSDGSAIPGLYAAGSTGQGGQLLEGHGHHLGWAFVSGRVAGRNAALASTTPS